MTDTAQLPDTTDSQLEDVLTAAAAAAGQWAQTSPGERAHALNAIADALDARAADLVTLAREETGLPEARLTGEVKRTSVQLRMFAQEVLDGHFFDVILDPADAEFALGPRPDLRRYQIALGPILVFAASNFPFAFSVAGGDTAAALAAGCPVVLKAHPGHLRTSALTAAIVEGALTEAQAPAGIFALITGFDAGVRALRDPRITGAAFTGSVAGGRALFDIASSRPVPIPFFGELGSVNPAIVTEGALEERLDEIATGFVDSFTLGAGQFCTKPGILLVPAGSPVVERITERAGTVAAARMLTAKIAEGYEQRVAETAALPGITVLVKGQITADPSGIPTVSPTLLHTTAANFQERSEPLLEESFGPAALIVEYENLTEVRNILDTVDGSLTVTFHTRRHPTDDESADLRDLTRLAATRAGRLVFNGWPTGVAVTPAQHHGGPYPATTAVSHTSVGTTAIRRFLRPVTYQDAPEGLLPEPMQQSNPLAVPRTVNTPGQSVTWGTVR